MGSVRYGELITSIDLARLELFGTDYIHQFVIQHILYERKELKYRYYLTDCLMAITQNTFNLAGKGTYMTVSYRELTESEHDTKPQETSEQVIDRIKNKLKNL